MKAVRSFFGGIILGILFLIIGICVLFFNEGNNVKNIKSIDEARDVLVLASVSPINKANDGTLVALNGKLSYENEYLYDSVFGVYSGKKTYKMKRLVEMYQWKEENGSDNNDKHRYKKVWSSRMINSSLFEDETYENPSSIPYDNLVIYADDVKLGDYLISNDNLRQVNTNEDVLITSSDLPIGYSLQNNYITNSNDLKSPEIGDIRISYKIVNSNEFSIVAKQEKNTLVDYISKQGKSIYMTSSGIVSGDELIKKLESGNNTLKWILRIAGIVLISFGCAGLISPVNRILNIIPVVGKKISGIVSLMALLSGACLSFIIIGISWLIYRPLIGILCLSLSGITLAGLIYIIKKNKGNAFVKSELQDNGNSNVSLRPYSSLETGSLNAEFNVDKTAETLVTENSNVPLQPWEQTSEAKENIVKTDNNQDIQDNNLNG